MHVCESSMQRKKECVPSLNHAQFTIRVIEFYNENIVGVDVVDQMLRVYSTRCATRRWPLGVLCKILDMAALNAWIFFFYKMASVKVFQESFSS